MLKSNALFTEPVVRASKANVFRVVDELFLYNVFADDSGNVLLSAEQSFLLEQVTGRLSLVYDDVHEDISDMGRVISTAAALAPRAPHATRGLALTVYFIRKFWQPPTLFKQLLVLDYSIFDIFSYV